MATVTGRSKGTKLITILIILICLAAIILYLFFKSSHSNIELIDLEEKDQPIQIISSNNSLINYQKIIIQNPFEIIINFTCEKLSGNLLDYTLGVINHDDGIKSPINVVPLSILVDVNDNMSTFLYQYYLEIHVTKETINDLELLNQYGFIKSEESKEGRASLNAGYIDCFVNTETKFLKEELPSIN